MNLDWTVSTHADVSIPDTDPNAPIVIDVQLVTHTITIRILVHPIVKTLTAT